MKNIFLQTIYKIISSVGKHFMLNKILLYLTRICSILFNKYPALYKVMDYFFTNLATFYSYLYSVGFKFHNKVKNNFPILYTITVYIYSEYFAIINGDLSRYMKVIIGLYVVFDCSKINIILYSLLILNA
jgi:hypothetical protein